MKYDYDFKIEFALNEPFDIERVNNACRQHPNSKILVEVQNTKGITSQMIRQLGPNIAIRIAGGYDQERISRYGKDLNWDGAGEYYNDAVIYTRNETIKILEEMEKIEAGMSYYWSDIQKLLYAYDRLKAGIMYDPEYEHKSSNEIRSLRGLISKKTVCAGYAMILKEFMDRSNISCEYVEGYTGKDKNGRLIGGHAWNIVNIEGKKYPIDLTWDNTTFRKGNSKSFDWLGKDVSEFSRLHIPSQGEKTQNYEQTLSQIDPQIIKAISSQIGVERARDYKATTFTGLRDDGTKFIIAQIGDGVIDNTRYYRYYYVDVAKDGTRDLPLILYSKTNLVRSLDCKKFNRPLPPHYLEAFKNVLFSRENIANSLANNTFYIGELKKEGTGNQFEMVTSPQEISKPEKERNLFTYPTRRYTRSDGSVFIAQKMWKTPHNIKGFDVDAYDIFEMVEEEGKDVVKRNKVFTERDFFKDNRKTIVDKYLSRERLDRKVKENGGYIGYCNANGWHASNPELMSYYNTQRRIDIGALTPKKEEPAIKIPTFEELKDLASKYELFIDEDKISAMDASSVKIRDIKTGQLVTDKTTLDKARFANIWLNSAGVRYNDNEARPGEEYAFSEQAKELYDVICKELLASCKSGGVIDTATLYKNIGQKSNYKYNHEILVNLFRTPYQTEKINELFLQSLGINKSNGIPETLYNFGYANELIGNEPPYANLFNSEHERRR